MALRAKQEDATIERCLYDRGLRLTEGRRMIIREVMGEHEHFGAENLYEKFREKGLRTSRATVYRTLPLLQACGIIQETRRTEKGAEYEVIYGREHHDHLRCLGCGRIIEFKSPEIEKLQKQICRKLGFEQTGHRHEIIGYCNRCQRKARRR